MSKVSCTSPIKLPQNTSLDVGAVLNKMFLFSTAYPSVKDVSFLFGLCTTLLIAICNWVAFEIRVGLPLPWVILNFVLKLSNATVNVWAVPEPTALRLMTAPLLASDNVAANLIVWVVSKII